MKSVGVVRKLDPLGRICLPRELRGVFKIDKGDPLEIFTDGDNIVLRKYNPGCQVCGNLENVHTVLGMKLCENHIKEIAKVVK